MIESILKELMGYQGISSLTEPKVPYNFSAINNYDVYITDNIEKIHEKYKFKLLNQKTFIETSKFRMNTILSQDISIKELQELISTKYNVELNGEDFIEEEKSIIFLSYLLSKHKYEHLSFTGTLKARRVRKRCIIFRKTLYTGSYKEPIKDTKCPSGSKSLEVPSGVRDPLRRYYC